VQGELIPRAIIERYREVAMLAGEFRYEDADEMIALDVNGQLISIEPQTLSYCTTVTDKAGDLAFENHILEWRPEYHNDDLEECEVERGVVCWSRLGFVLEIHNEGHEPEVIELGFEDGVEAEGKLKDWVIIGDIFDGSDLAAQIAAAMIGDGKNGAV